MTTEELLRELRAARSLLDRHEPDRSRRDWVGAANDLIALRRSLDGCSAALGGVLADIEEPGDRETVRTGLAQCHADAAALFAASGDAEAARQLLRRAVELGGSDSDLSSEWRAAQADPDRFADLAHGRLLWRRGDISRARSLLKRVAGGEDDRLTGAARAVMGGPVPLSGPPTLFTINGFGLTLVGRRDHRSDGSYVTTHCLSALFVPILPLAAYRVTDGGGGTYYFHAREQLGSFARRARFLAPLALALLVAGISIAGYLDSTSRRIGKALDAAGQLERDGRLDQALSSYDQAITDFFDADSAAELEPAAAGIMRITAARIAQPAGAGSVEAIRRVVLRYQGLHAALRSPEVSAALRDELIAWAGQIGGRDLPARRSSLRVLELAASVTEADVGWRVDRARTQLAAELADERPIEALRQYAAIGDRRSTIEPTAAILATFEPGSSLWLEAEKEVEAWLSAAGGHPRAADIRAQLDEVRRRERDPGRAALLGGDAAALAAAALIDPRDQGLAVALARARRDTGVLDQALATLTALGRPGRLTAEAQTALGSLYADAGKLDEAERVLSGLLISDLGAYQDAVSRYERAAVAAEEALVEKGQRGELPPDVLAALNGASPDKQREIGSAWLRKELEQDPRLARLADEVSGRGHVVPAALILGMVRLRLASAADGEARQRHLADAEAAFLSVRTQAEGRPELHLGLGQVYHRLGRVEEGESELARVLAEKDARLRLQVGEVYRDLGLREKAIQVAERVWNDAGDERGKDGAAQLRSLLAESDDEKETWLARADQSNPFVRRSLTTVRAERKLREGDAAGADALFAEVAGEYGKEAARDGTSANNAAVAEGDRFRCTGDLRHLEKAATYMAQAHRLQPESAIVAGNVVSAWRILAIDRALGAWFDVRALRPGYQESAALLAVLARGPDRAKLRERLTGDAAFRRSNDVMRQWQILAPQNAEAYALEETALDVFDDGPGLASLRERLTRVTLNPSTDYSEWMSGSNDDVRRVALAANRARYERLLATVHEKRTRAAVFLLLADTLLAEATMGDAAALYAERERVLSEAASLYPYAGIERELAGARMYVAIMGAVDSSAEVRALWEPRRRSHGWGLLAHLITEASPAARDALRRQPQLAAARPVLEREMHEDVQLEHWVVARALGDAAMEKRAAEAIRGSNALVRARVGALLRPEVPSRQETFALVEKIVATGG